jgi:hypothetical protein
MWSITLPRATRISGHKKIRSSAKKKDLFNSIGSKNGLPASDRYWRAPCKDGAFQWVKIPPGNRSSRKQSEQSWR